MATGGSPAHAGMDLVCALTGIEQQEASVMLWTDIRFVID